MFGHPLFDPLKGWITIEDVDLRNQFTSQKVIKYSAAFGEIGQSSASHHEEEAAAKDLVLLKLLLNNIPKIDGFVPLTSNAGWVSFRNSSRRSFDWIEAYLNTRQLDAVPP